jgi:hypothetical protein
MSLPLVSLTPVPMMLVAATVAAGLALGGLALALASVLPATSPKARPIWPVFATEVVIVAAAVLPFVAGGALLDLALVLLAIRVGYEATRVALLRLGRSGGDRARSCTSGCFRWLPVAVWRLPACLPPGFPFPLLPVPEHSWRALPSYGGLS